MTTQQLAEIKARCEAATPGPWTWVMPNKDCGFFSLVDGNGAEVHSDGSACGEYPPDINVNGPDGKFIAHARQDVPEMLGYINHLESVISEVHREVKELYEADTLDAHIATILQKALEQ